MADITSFDLMRETIALKNQTKMIRLIANDLYNRYLVNFVSEVKEDRAKQLNPNRKRNEFDGIDDYIYDLDAVILEVIGFSNEQIENELGYWYYTQLQQVATSPKAINKTYLWNSAIRIYFELKDLLKLRNKDLGAIIRDRMGKKGNI